MNFDCGILKLSGWKDRFVRLYFLVILTKLLFAAFVGPCGLEDL